MDALLRIQAGLPAYCCRPTKIRVLQRVAAVFVGAVALSSAAVHASPGASISVGNHNLLPNTAGQTFTVSVTGSAPLGGEDFFAQIGDGGSFNGGSNTRPKFTNVDILGGVFSGNNTGATGDPGGTPKGNNAGHPLIWVDGTTTNSGTVVADGVLATFTVDTTGIFSGSYPLALTGVASSFGPFDTTLRDSSGSAIPLNVANGSITISPEPASLALMAVAGAMVLRRRSRRIVQQ